LASNPKKIFRYRSLRTMSIPAVVFAVLFIAITFAGFNSGNNLLYLIAGVMLASIFVSLIAGRVNLFRIDVKRRLPTYAFAGHPFRVRLEIINGKRFFHSFGLILEGVGEKSAPPPVLFSIQGGGERSREAEMVFQRRGLHKLPPLIVKSKFPLGLFEPRREVADPQEMIVYPRIYDLEKKLGGSSHLQDEFPRHLKGPGSGLYGVREYRHGEDAANISWKLSAKLDRLIVRETEQEGKRRVCIVFDNTLQDDSEAALEAFENAVNTAASLAWYLCRSGYSVKLITRDKIVRYGEGSEQMHKILITLALVDAASPGAKEISAGRGLTEGGTGVLVGCRDGKTAGRRGQRDFAMVFSERVAAERT